MFVANVWKPNYTLQNPFSVIKGHIAVAWVKCWFGKGHWSWWLYWVETIHIFAIKVHFTSNFCRNGLRAERKGNSGVIYDWRKMRVKTSSAKYLWTKICYCCSWWWWSSSSWWWWRQGQNEPGLFEHWVADGDAVRHRWLSSWVALLIKIKIKIVLLKFWHCL